MLAATVMSQGAQAIFFLIAFIVFAVGAVLFALQRAHASALVAGGLAAWVFVAMWNAWALS
jgi:hypothetical protein